MAGLRHSIQKRQHRERAQPLERKKYGLLEKHKDYALRAKDFREKKKHLKGLKERAVNRNPDEFHFGMMSTHMKDGRKVLSRGNKVLDMDVARLLKTQDAGYIRTLLQKTRIEREQLEQELQLVGEGADRGLQLLDENKDDSSKHTMFVDDSHEQSVFTVEIRPQLDQRDNTNVLPTEQHSNGKSRKALEQERAAKTQEQRLEKKRVQSQQVRRDLLAAIRQRERALIEVAEELEIQRNRMNNNNGSVTKAGEIVKQLNRKRKS